MKVGAEMENRRKKKNIENMRPLRKPFHRKELRKKEKSDRLGELVVRNWNNAIKSGALIVTENGYEICSEKMKRYKKKLSCSYGKEKKMRVLTIANQKGGISKTTTTLNIGAGLLREGKKVLLVDLDTQGDLTYNVGAKEQPYSLVDVVENKALLVDVIQHIPNGLDIIPASLDLMELESRVVSFDFSSLNYDFILLDCPPNMAGNTVAAIRASDAVLVPATADFYAYKSVRAIAQSLITLDRPLNGIILTRFAGRMVINKQILKDLKNLATEINTKLYNSIIRECVAVRESQLMQQSIFDYDSTASAAEDYAALVKEIIQEE